MTALLDTATGCRHGIASSPRRPGGSTGTSHARRSVGVLSSLRGARGPLLWTTGTTAAPPPAVPTLRYQF
jgi:hypothetical protein